MTDVVTLRNLAAEARSIGIGECMFIIDRGFYSEGNIEMLKEAKIDFIMPLPFGRKVGKGLISETNTSIAVAENARIFKDEVYHVVEEVPGVEFVNNVEIMNEDRRIHEESVRLRDDELVHLIDVEVREKARERIG